MKSLVIPCTLKKACIAVIALGLTSVAGLSLAQPPSANYPARPIRLVVPFTPGGSTDILGRAIATELSKAWGQPVVVENTPGAGGSIGAEKVARAPADGYTLLMGHIGTLAVNPGLYPKLPYNPVRDFSPVAWVARVPNVLVVHPTVPAKDFREFLSWLKVNPGKLNYGSGGNGSAANLATEYLKLKTSVSMVHVPYRGTAPAVTDLIGGQIQVMFTGVPAVLGQIRSGQLRALAISSASRMALLPDLPAIAEAPGLAGFEADQWYGVVAPAGVPTDIVLKINARINEALASPELRQRLASEGAIATPSTPEVFGKLIASEIARWRPVMASGRVKAE